MEFKINVNEITGFESYSGYISVNPPTYLDRMKNMKEIGIQFKKDEGGNIQVEFTDEIDLQIKRIGITARYIKEVNVINTKTNISYKSFDDLMSDADLDQLTNYLCDKITHGFSLGKSQRES